MKVTLQPVRLALENDEEGVLIFADGTLAALFVRLSPIHDRLNGQWFFEASFDRRLAHEHLAPLFDDMGSAQAWITEKLSAGATAAT
jgi:hypothetical protein